MDISLSAIGARSTKRSNSYSIPLIEFSANRALRYLSFVPQILRFNLFEALISE